MTHWPLSHSICTPTSSRPALYAPTCRLRWKRSSSGRSPRFAVTPRHNLPIQLTSFVGRERESVEVKQMLSTSRLVTLTGTGGCGKTRLALKVAEDGLAEYSDGVWLVELAPVSDPALVPQTVAALVGVREEPG